jgi:hypothetical protein
MQMLVELPQPWMPARATERIRAIAADKGCTWHYKRHVKDRLTERDLLIGDINYLMKNGFVRDEAAPSTRQDLYKYVIASVTPNSGSRVVAVVVIPDWRSKQLKVITVMWQDEVTQSG